MELELLKHCSEVSLAFDFGQFLIFLSKPSSEHFFDLMREDVIQIHKE
jgi:hypothetical protein